ncbi:hypothetical protein HUJ04_006954 [Dendroctonus ponderosae]|nr:hypothetical protein HUJ04_006954 [Dendroctonus ponderosae]
MSSNKITCCVPKCYDVSSRRYCLPKSEDDIDIWIRQIKNEHLIGIINSERPALRNYGHYIVCARHFNEMCFRPGGKLILRSLPTKELPDDVAVVNTAATTFTGTSPIKSVLVPQKVYSGRKRPLEP